MTFLVYFKCFFFFKVGGGQQVVHRKSGGWKLSVWSYSAMDLLCLAGLGSLKYHSLRWSGFLLGRLGSLGPRMTTCRLLLLVASALPSNLIIGLVLIDIIPASDSCLYKVPVSVRPLDGSYIKIYVAETYNYLRKSD